MSLANTIVVITVGSLCLWAVGQSLLTSFFAHKEELINRMKSDLEKGV